MIQTASSDQQADSRYKQMWMHERNRRIEVEQENIRLRKIVYNPKFSMNERAVAIEIAEQVKDARHVDEQGRKLFSQQIAIEKLGLSKGTISSAVDVLTESGYIKDKDTSVLRDKEGKIVKNKKGLPISTIHLDIEQDAYEDFSKLERSVPRKVGKDRKEYTWQCQTCLTEDVTIETDRYLVCKNPNCHKHGQRVLIDTSYEDQCSEEHTDRAQNLDTIQTEATDLYRAQNLDTKELLDDRAQNLYPVEAEDESNKKKHTPSTPLDHDSIIKEWLGKLRGTDHIITATGIIDNPQGKYLYQKQGYQPDLDAYIAGHIDHIYGSRLLNPETGLTWALCFEIDRAEQDAEAENYLLDLARAGAAPVYEQRYAQGRQRGHLKLYFDQPVDPEAARQWAIEICPDLADVPECFPCKVPQDKRNQALSWPLYQRIENKVYPCQAIYMLPAPHAGDLQECDPIDRESLASLVALAVTPATLIEEFATVLAEREALQKQEQERANAVVVFIGQKPKPLTNVGYDRDLIPQVMADFYAQCSWDDLAMMADGWHNGFFKAIWRGERTASVKPDSDGRYACDYGNHGSFPKKLDKYEVYCLLNNIDKKADLAERCAQLRRAEMKVVESVPIVEPATELFAPEQRDKGPVYGICCVCTRPKSVRRADGVMTCGTDHVG
jgi:hypothetical protein